MVAISGHTTAYSNLRNTLNATTNINMNKLTMGLYLLAFT